MNRITTWRHGALGLALALGALTATAAPAFAHVEAEASSASDGATKVAFTVEEECTGAGTQSVRIQLPAGTTDVTAEDPTGWASKVTATELDWNRDPAATGKLPTFEATMKLTAKAGDTVLFPTIQGCPGGDEKTWVDKDAKADNPAPRIVVGETTAPPADDHDKETTTTVADHDKEPAGTSSTTAQATGTTAATKAPGTTVKATDPATTPASTSSNTGLIIGGIIAALIVLAIVGVVVSRGRGKTTP